MRAEVACSFKARGSLLGILLLLASCALPPGELGPEHRPSGLVAPLPEPDFGAYVTAARQHVSAAYADRPLTPEVIEARAPFEIVPDSRRCPRRGGRWPEGVLLIHGLGGTPYEMRDLGRALADACLLVRAVLLPGHGTVPGDLLDVDHTVWVDATRQGVASFAGVAETVHLAGFSEGGALALHYALLADPPDGLDLGALLLLAPALAPRPSGGFLGFAGSVAGRGGDPREAWQSIHTEDDPLRYGSLPWNAVGQGEALAAELRGRREAMDRPVFLALSAEDAGVDTDFVRRWFCRGLIGPRRLIWYAAGAEPFSDCRFITVRDSAADPAILDYARRALPVAPENARYGRRAEAFDCRHYYWDAYSPNWLLCADRTRTPENSQIRYGEVRRENLDRAIVRRLTYNPDFAQLSADLLRFLDNLRTARRAPIPRLRPDR